MSKLSVSDPNAPVIVVQGVGGGGKALYSLPPDWAFTAMVWLGSSAVSGIIGSVAYDGLQQLLHKLLTVRRDQRIEKEDAILLARVSTVIRCQSLNLPGPDLNSLTVEVRTGVDGGWSIMIENEELAASVEIPIGNPNRKRVSVTIHRHQTLEQRREQLDEIERRLRDTLGDWRSRQ
jgi:hypothetical protein